MANLEWFYIQQWNRKQYEKLQEHRTVLVEWETDGEEVDIPSIVKIPKGVALTNLGICSYLSEEYGWLVNDWKVARESLESK